MVLCARAKLGVCKGAGSDGVTAEIIRALPPLIIYFIFAWFRAKLEGWKDVPSCWLIVILCFIRKIAHPRNFEDLRGIFLISSFSKWFMQCIMLAAETVPIPPRYKHICNFGFEVNCQTIDIAGSLLVLVDRSREWARQVPLFV